MDLSDIVIFVHVLFILLIIAHILIKNLSNVLLVFVFYFPSFWWGVKGFGFLVVLVLDIILIFSLVHAVSGKKEKPKAKLSTSKNNDGGSSTFYWSVYDSGSSGESSDCGGGFDGGGDSGGGSD